MGDFLLGMLVMWFTYPLLNVTREVMAEKFMLAVIGKEKDSSSEDEEETNVSMGFQLNEK